MTDQTTSSRQNEAADDGATGRKGGREEEREGEKRKDGEGLKEGKGKGERAIAKEEGKD